MRTIIHDRVWQFGDTSLHRPRIVLLLMIVTGHVLLLLLLFMSHSAEEQPSSTALTLFDTRMRTSLPPALPRRAIVTPGGSPGVKHENASFGVSPLPSEETPDISPVPLSMDRFAVEAGTSPLALGQGGAGDTGAGTGTGHGDGRGTAGDAAGNAFARAEWIKRPPLDAYKRYWPVNQVKEQGAVRMSCYVRDGGRPRDCSIISEAPAGVGFGAAAIRIVGEGRVQAITEDGTARPDLPVLIAIHFDTMLAPKSRKEEPSRPAAPCIVSPQITCQPNDID